MSCPLDLNVINGTVYYGEYFNNHDKEEVNIYKRTSGWTKVYSFAAGEIRHIHNVVEDTINKRIIILTGDNNSQAGIFSADYDFKEVKTIARGSQNYRACNIFSTKEGYLYATDTGVKNKIFLLNQDGLKEVYNINSSNIYSASFDDKYYFSTTVEPNYGLKGLKKVFNYYYQRDTYSRLYLVYNGKATELLGLKKRFFSSRFLDFPTIKFCKSTNKKVLLNLVGVRKYDGCFIELDRLLKEKA